MNLQNRKLRSIIDTWMGKMLRYQSQNLKQESSRKTGYIVRYVLLVVQKNMRDEINLKKLLI